MDANLVGSAGVKNRFDQRRTAQSFENMIRGPRGPAHVFVHRHAFAMGRMAGNGRPNLSPLPLNLAANNRMISLIHAPTSELGRKSQVRVIVLRDHKATARIFIETMHDSRPRNAPDPAQFPPTMME